MSEKRTKRSFVPALLILVGGVLPLLATFGPLGDFAILCWFATPVLFIGGAAWAAHDYQQGRQASPHT